MSVSEIAIVACTVAFGVLIMIGMSVNEHIKKNKRIIRRVSMDSTQESVSYKSSGIGGSGNSFIWSILSIFGFNIVRPTCRGLVERLGKYHRFVNSGFCFVIPIFERLIHVNITEQMVDAEPQEIITNDNLNASVDAQVYFKVKSDETSVKRSQYSVNDCRWQIVNLARTTLRNIIGTLTLKSANSERDKINKELYNTLLTETDGWGIEIVRTELKQIDPPKDVQETMNKVVKAENEKVAAVDFATAAETVADGKRRAVIKEAEGARQSTILRAEGDKQAIILTATANREAIVLEANGRAESIKLVNEAAEKYFINNAQALKRLEVTQSSLQNNSKIVVPADSSLINMIGNISGDK